MSIPLTAATTPDLAKDDLVVIAGAGGFIGGSLARHFHDQGFTRIRAIDKKPLPEWYQRVPGVENLCLDLSEYANCVRACEGATEVYNRSVEHSPELTPKAHGEAWRPTRAAWASSSGFASSACAAS
jgi:nucleoside-diphosphate-sugar epimerase